MSIINVGIIGYGMSAKVFHIPLITIVPAFKLYAIVQRHPGPDNDVAKDHPGVKAYRASDEVMNDPTVDVIVITTTPDTHFQLAKLALESGKHVVVEKPFAPTHQECEELIEIAKNHKRLLTVYQNRRWDTDFLTLSKLLKDNTLGRVVEFETHYDRHRPEATVSGAGGWKAKPLPGGGAAYDLGTHLIDQVVVTYGLPRRITGFVGTQRENNTNGYEDSCTILFHYDGMLATVKAAVVSPEANQLRYWVRGDKGSYKKYHIDCQEDQLKAGMKPVDKGFGIEPQDRSGILSLVEGSDFRSKSLPNIEPQTYGAFYTQFAQALAGKGDVPVNPKIPSQVIRLIEMARQSTQEGRTLEVGP